MLRVRPGVLLVFSVLACRPALAQEQSIQAARLIEQHCMSCHGNPAPDSRAPNRDALRQFSPERVLAALTTGAMAAQAKSAGLTDDQKRFIAEYIASRSIGAGGVREASAMSNRCAAAAPLGDPSKSPAWNGWSPDDGNARFQKADAARLTADQVPRLTLKWAFGVPGATSMYGQPSIVSGRAFFGSDAGFVYSVDADTGCVHWSFEAKAGVRTAVVIAPYRGAPGVRYAAYFGDLKSNVYAVDADSGRQLWTAQVETHALSRITGGLRVSGNQVFVPVASWEESSGYNITYQCCTFRGSVVALEAATGRQMWKSFTISEEPKPVRKNSIGTQLWGPAGGGVWNTPTIDLQRQTVYIGVGNAYTAPAADTTDGILALDMKTGRKLWHRQMVKNDAWIEKCRPKEADRTENCPDVKLQNVSYNDVDMGASPILRPLPGGRRVLLIAGESGGVYALDPDREGALVWQTHLGDPAAGQGQPGIGFGGAADDEAAYYPLERSVGGLTALNLSTGERVWHTPGQGTKNCPEGIRACSAAQHAAATVIPGVVFSGSADGTLRAYSAADGQVIWQFNTAQPFKTVNDVPAKGGTLRGPGATVVGGVLFVGSGYGLGGIPGNVLLAFGVER
jgi:polyvinyl alcohol dehydrogenase (cytochrome)